MTILLWTAFIVFVLVMLALDLGVFNRKAHVISTAAAIRWTMVTVVLALLFAVGVYFIYQNNPEFGAANLAAGPSEANTAERMAARTEKTVGLFGFGESRGGQAVLLYLTGWLVEYALSMDNIFVIAVIFAHFKVPPQHQHRVLFWGILGALIMRGAMIAVGAQLISRFEWILYIFGAILIFTAIKLLLQKDEENFDPSKGITLRLAKRVFPVSETLEGEKFFTWMKGPDGVLRRAITPLFMVLLVVETTDVIFAVDSIPAVFSITQDPFLVFTSNVFAILGLRSLYFALAGMMNSFRFLKPAIALVLLFIGIKMLAEIWIHINAILSLGIIVTLLLGGVVLSLAIPAKPKHAGGEPEDAGKAA